MVENSEPREVATTPHPHPNAPPLLVSRARRRALSANTPVRSGGTPKVASGRHRIRWVVASVLALALVTGAVGAYFVVNSVVHIGAPAIQLTELRDLPRADAWSQEHPLVNVKGAIPYLTGYSVDQDRALVLFGAIDSDGSPNADTQLALLDTLSGETVWSIGWDASDFSVVSEPAARPYLVSSIVGRTTVITALDAQTGTVLSDTTALGSVTVLRAASPTSGTSPLRDDVLLEFDGEISRVTPQSLDQPLWSIDLDGEKAQLSGDRLIVDGDGFDLETGDEVRWRGDRDLSFVPSNSALLGISAETDDDDRQLIRFADDGETRWAVDLSTTASVLFVGQGELIINDVDEAEVYALDLANGEERWIIDLEVAASSAAYGSEYAGVLLLPSASDRFTMVDLDTGAVLFEHRYAAADRQPRVLGVTGSLFYLAGAESGSLSAWDSRSGAELWELDGRGPSYVVAWGGRLVSVALTADEPHAALQGIAG